MRIAFLLIALLVCLSAQSQDTITYSKLQSIGKTYVLIETIELYSDSSFTWTNKHDLSWNENGLYTLKDDTLTLDFYFHDLMVTEKTDSFDWRTMQDTLVLRKTIKYFIDGRKMYKVKENGRLEKWTRDKTLFRDEWRWLFLGFRKTFYRLED